MTQETVEQQQKRAKDELQHVVTVQSTDAQLNAKAQRCAYIFGGNQQAASWLHYQIFALQREVAALKAAFQINPALAGVEKR